MITVQVFVNLLNQESDSLATFLLNTNSRGTALTTEVQHLLGFININTDLELCLVSQREKSTHNTRHVHAHKHLP